MLFQLFREQPLIALAWVAVIILALTVHEFAHALVGSWRGDDTAERMGRMTLNPFAHLDIVGTLMLLFVGFGWAKPVPFDPRKLKNPIIDGMTIALAGPTANLFLAAIGATAFRLLQGTALMEDSLLPIFLTLLIFVNLLLLFFNLIPIPPLDGSKVLDAVFYEMRADRLREIMHRFGPQLLLGLVIISLVIPSINIFSFIQIPSILACDAMTGVSCIDTLSSY